jgi:DNA-binding transcriptional regulator YhcF (GntR family)
VPPYEQLRAQLARQIQKRVLAVGTRLPTIRRLAADLGLAVNTVGRAYRDLEEAGLIETRGRAGSFVSAAGEQARRAARDYAAVIASVGIDPAEAIRIVQAALGGASNPEPPFTRSTRALVPPGIEPRRVGPRAGNRRPRPTFGEKPFGIGVFRNPQGSAKLRCGARSPP